MAMLRRLEKDKLPTELLGALAEAYATVNERKKEKEDSLQKIWSREPRLDELSASAKNIELLRCYITPSEIVDHNYYSSQIAFAATALAGVRELLERREEERVIAKALENIEKLLQKASEVLLRGVFILHQLESKDHDELWKEELKNFKVSASESAHVTLALMFSNM